MHNGLEMRPVAQGRPSALVLQLALALQVALTFAFGLVLLHFRAAFQTPT
jgi:hypothetical protein